MIKKLIECYIRRTKNSKFSFDKNTTYPIIISLILRKIFALFRGLKLCLVHRNLNKIFLGKSVDIFNIHNIKIGNNVIIGNYVRLYALGLSPLSIGNNVNIGSFTQIVISTTFNDYGEHIKIGDNVGIGEFSYLGGAGGLTIGDDTIIGQYFSAHPENHFYSDSCVLIREQGVHRQGISIGTNCWIGSKVTILDGVIIGDGCVIAAGAVVTKSYPKNVVIAGVPAKIIKRTQLEGPCLSS